MAFIQCDFFSEVLGISTSMNVILPQKTRSQIGMDGVADEEEPPLLYLLHGLSDDHTIWMRRTSVERYAAPYGIAVVMPAVDKSFYVDMAKGERFGEFVAEELPEIVHSFFKVSSEPAKTYVAGLSMGGYGAFRLALSNPARFAAAASLSGVMDIEGFRKRDDLSGRGLFERVFGNVPTLEGTEYDLFHLAAKIAEGDPRKPRLYQCCGANDFLHDENTRFNEYIGKLPFDHLYEEWPGVHEWGFWDVAIQKALRWMLDGDGNAE